MEIKTTWGAITLTLNGDNVVALDLPYLKTVPRKPFVIEELQTLENLVRYFPNIGSERSERGPVNAGQRPKKAAKPDGTAFQQAVWNEMIKIPRGQTRTYGEIAAAIGKPKAVRAVGSACGANPLPLFIPCHRVVAKNGLGGFGSGLPWKKLLLRMEGWSNGVLE